MVPDFSEIKQLRVEELRKDSGGLKQVIVKSVDNMCASIDEAALLFSGGVDSTLLAVLLSERVKVKCYTAGFEGAQDLEWGQRVADELNLDLKIVILDGLESLLPEIIKVIQSDNIMKVGVSVPLYSCCKECKEGVVFSGVGSEEIFAGYQRHVKSYESGWQKMQEEMWKGIDAMWERDVERDTRTATHFGLQLRAPFTDKEVIQSAMQIHPSLKYNGGDLNKLVLREIARELGVPESVCNRPKKAAQYGSLADREIRKLAKKKGFRSAQDYLSSLSKP